MATPLLTCTLCWIPAYTCIMLYISLGTELLVWYGNVYARDLGIIPGGNQSDSLPDGSPATSDNCTATPSTLTRKRRRIKLPNECFPKRKLKFVLKNNTGIPKKHEVESNSGTVKMQQSALREEYMSTFHSGVNAQKPKTNAATSLERKTDPNLLAKFVYKKYFEKVKKSKMLDAKTRLGDLLKYLRFNLKTETYKHQSCINGRNGLDKVGNGNQETEENTKCSPRPKQIDLKNENELSGSRKPDGDKTIKSLAAVKGVSDPVSPDSKKEQEDNDSKRRKEKENRDPRTVICDSKYDNNSQKNEPCFKGGNVKHVHKSDKATENNSAWEQIRRWKIPCKSEHRKASMSDRIQNEFHIADKDKTIRSSPLPVDCSSQSHSGEETVSTISSDSGSRKRPRSHSRSHSESRSDVEITTKTNERLLEKCTEHGDKSSERNQQRERNMVLYKSTDSYSKSATSTRNCMHGSSTYRNSLHNYKRNIELSTRNKLSRGSYHDRYKRRQDNDNCRRNRRISDSLYDSDTYTSYSSSPQSPNHHMSRKFYDRSHSRERSVDSFSDNNETPKHRRRDRDCVMKGGHGLKTDIQKTNNIENIKRNEKSSPQSSNYNMSQRSWNRPFCRNTHVESLSENNETSKYRQRGRTHENEDNFSKKYAENVKRTEVSSSRHQKDEKPYQRHESRSDRLSEKENCAHKSDIITFGEQNSEKKQIKCEPNGCDDKTKAHPATQKLTTLSIPQLPSNKNVKTSTYVKFQCLKDENFHGKRESQGIKDDKYSDIHKNKISTTKSKQNRLDQQQVDFHGVVFMESHVDSLVTSLSPSVLSKEDRTSLLTPNTGQTQESNHSTMGIESKTNSVAVLPTISRMKHSIGESSPVVAEKDVGISIFHKMSPNVAGELREAAFLKHFNVQSSTESYSDSESTTDFENDQLAVISELVQINNLINAQAKLKILACHINESMDSSELMEISKLLNTQDQLNELSRQYMESQTSETGEDNGSNFTIPTSLIHDFQNSLSDIAAINGEADMDIASPTHDVGYIELPSSYASSVESKDVIDMEIGSPINNTGYIELDMEMGSPIINRGKIELAPCHKSLNDEHVLDLVGNNRTIDMEMGSPIHKTGRIEVLKSSLTESQSDCITRKRDNIKTSRNLANDFGIQSGSHNEDKVVGCTEASTTITMPSLLNSSFLGHNGTDFNKELLDKYMNDFLITKAKDSTSFCPSQHSNDEVTSENSRFGYNISQMGPEKQNLDNEMRIKDFLKTELDQENKMLVKNVRDKEISANIIMKQECLKNELDQGIKTYETVIMDSLKVEPVMAAKSNVIKACDKAELVKDITVKNHVIKCCDKAEQAKDITAKSKVIKDRQMAEQAKDITAKSKVIKDRQMAEQAKDITAKSKVIKDRQMAEQAKDITAESKVIKDRQMAEQAKDITAKSKVIKDRQMAEQAKDITAESKVIKDRQMAEQAKDITAKSKVAKDRQRVEQAKDMTAKSMVINGCKKEEPVKVLMANNMVVKDNQRIPDKLETSKRMSDQNMVRNFCDFLIEWHIILHVIKKYQLESYIYISK